jgi:hypothetical protein
VRGWNSTESRPDPTRQRFAVRSLPSCSCSLCLIHLVSARKHPPPISSRTTTAPATGMTDTAEPRDPSMHDGSAHASTTGDPPPLASAPVNTDSVCHPCYSSASETSKPSKPANLTLSTSDASRSTNDLPADPVELTPPTSAISSPGDAQATESLSQPESSQSAAEATGDDRPGEPRAGSTSQSPAPEISSGTKRTASGEVKRASVNGLGEVLAKPNGAGHAHTSSTVSNGSKGNVLEVSYPVPVARTGS